VSLDPDVRIGPLPTAVYLGPDYQFATWSVGQLAVLVSEIEDTFDKRDGRHFAILMMRLRDALGLPA
jgi:hypothetical protein